ncbi:MAG: hypothetical protein R6W97_09490 [Thiobacillus sp.]
MNFKPALLLLSLCQAGSAAALGLGDLNVRSHLGQPLHVTVNILNPTAVTKTDCFSLAAHAGNIAPPSGAHLSLEQAGGQTQLHIRTAKAVFDPIAQFVLTSDCDIRLQREYVVLLDPPAQMEPALIHEQPAAAPTTATAEPAARPAHKPRRSTRAARVVPRVSAATALAPAAPRATAQADATPRLVLSGRHGSGDSAFALRFDTALPDLNRPRPEGLTAVELSDENTALTRKLAYLESQLTALQLRNAQLEGKPGAQAAAVAPPPGNPVQWSLYMMLAGLVAGGVALAVWLRRRSRKPAEEYDIWNPPGKTRLPKADLMESDPDVRPAPQRMAEIERPAPSQMIEIDAPGFHSSTEVKDNILDQAEVYMAHGHGDLAIHMLQEHLRDDPTDSPVPWLLLLDLLHRDGDSQGYDAASAECRRHFNVDLSSPPVSQDIYTGKGLEAYPHLMERVIELWHTAEAEPFFQDLIYDNRGGTRLGFETGAYHEILLLRAIARESMPHAA